MTKDDTACPFCQSKDLVLKYVLTDPAYHAAKCRQCAFVAMHPYPSDTFLDKHYKARALYNSGQARNSYDRAVADRASLIDAMLRRADITSRCGPSIDFGAGVGIAVAAQASLGFKAVGVETNPHATREGRETFGVEIEDLTFDEMPYDLRLFTLFEVLEHIKYPADFLSAACRHMAPGSAIIGSVPNYNGLARYVRGKHSIALIWPEHINQFTRKTLAQTLTAAGFDVVYIGFPPPYGVVFSLGVRAWLRRALPEGILKKAAIDAVTFIKKHVAYPLPNAFAESTGLLGHGLVFVAVPHKAERVAD